MAKFLCFFFVTLLLACESAVQESIVELTNPSGNNSGESSLYADEDGSVYLSWIDLEDDTISILKYAQLENGKFQEAKEISRGSNWFVNWADFPAIVKFPSSKKLLVHWLQKSAEGTYDYDVRVSSSNGKGDKWSTSQILHNDGVAAEHGFVSITPYKQRLIATWLDGRKMKKEDSKESSGHGHGHGAMTLRSAIIDIDNSVSNRVELDNQVCECCQTDVAVTEEGPIVVYRNKSDDNIRDIYYTRAVGDDWTIPKPIYEDNWKITGCPVNGPRVATSGKRVAVAWYSGSDQNVKVVLSSDNGAHFSDPIVVNENVTLGRVDVAFLNSEEVVISYLEDAKDIAKVKLRKLDIQHQIKDPITVGATSPTRSSGFPRLATTNKQLYVSYTYVDSTSQRVVSKAINI